MLEAGGASLASGGEGASGGPDFDYTKLNAIKPALIAEATANARRSTRSSWAPGPSSPTTRR